MFLVKLRRFRSQYGRVPVTLGDGGNNILNLSAQFANFPLGCGALFLLLGRKPLAFLSVGLDVLSNRSRALHFRPQCGQHPAFDVVNVEGLRVRTRPAFGSSRATDTNAAGLVGALSTHSATACGAPQQTG